MKKLIFKLAPTAVACISAALLTASLVAGPASASHASKRSTHRISQELLRVLPVLRSHRHSAHAAATIESRAVSMLMTNMRTSVDPGVAAQGLDTSAAVEVDPASAASPVWIVPGSAGACVLTQHPEGGKSPAVQNRIAAGGGCSDTATIQDQGSIGVAFEPGGKHLVYGAVPAGNSSVTITLPSGATTVAPVTDNTVSVVVPAFPTAISFKSSAGTPVVLNP